MTFGIVVTVYPRKDGKSPLYLKRCLDSVKAQTYIDYGCLVVGDKYDKVNEIREVIPNDFSFINNPVAYEREKYTGKQLWCCGGLQSALKGIQMFLEIGVTKLILLDYDDYWSKDHLATLSQGFSLPGVSCVFTKSKHIKGFLPKYKWVDHVIPMTPEPSGVIKSSVCWDYSQIPLLPRNVYEETGKIRPSDADLWKRISKYIFENNIKSIHINKLTCFHEEEKHIIKEKPNVK